MDRSTARLRLAALAVGALILRPQLIGVGPLVPLVREDLGLSYAQAGLLSTIPLICMGVFALATPAIVAALGAGRTVTLALAMIVGTGAVRAASPDGAWLLVLTVAVGIGIGIAGAAFPVLVKSWLAGQGALATGIYTTAIQVGATGAVYVAVPLAAALGGWRGSMAAFAAAGAVSLAGWWLLAERTPRPARGAGDRRLPPLAVRNPVAWLLAAIFALTAIPYYGLAAWLPAAYVERGWDAASAGALFASFGLSGLPASLVVSVLADRWGSRQRWMVVASAVVAVCITGLVVAPGLAWVWALVGGAFLAMLFTLGLVLPLDVSHDPARVGPVVGLMMFVGYLLMAGMPSFLGAVRDLTGSFTTSLWILAGAALLLLVASLLATPARLAGRS